MKKICMLFVSIIILPVMLSATPMNVVGEVFTSTYCGYCPSARQGLRDLADAFDNVIPLIWQSPSGYVGMVSPNYSTRVNMYGVGGIPHAFFGGYLSVSGGYPSGSMYSNYLPCYNTINGLESPLAMDIVMDYSSKSTIEIHADVEVTGNISTANNKIVFLVTNKYDDDYACSVVEYYEEDFGLTTIGETETYSASFTYDPEWGMLEIKAVAFVQKFSSDYKILQGATCSLNGIYPALSSTIQSGPPQLRVQFYNESYPIGGTCEWDFDSDGMWDSTEENPYYCYNAVGTYDVTLRVTNGDNSETITLDDYITVTNTSDISGSLSGKWTEAYSPYTITDDVNIPEGLILEIEPNVEIRTNNGSRITIEGYLSALGDDGENIIFTTDDTWKGILFSNSDYENVLSYAQVTGATDCAVDIESSNVTISHCEFYDNSISSDKGPAIAIRNTDDVNIEWNLVSNNTSSNLCGAISLDNSSPLIERNIIVNNQASTAGAFSMKNGSCPELINNTIANNSSSYAFSLFSASNPTIENCIIRHSGNVFVNFLSSPAIIYCDVSGGYTGTGNIEGDPLFVDPQNGDYRLSWTHHPVADSTKSPCIDAGNPDSPYDPDGTIADIGALYFNQDIAVDDPELPEMILQSYPNPAQNLITISYSIKGIGNNETVDVHVFNLKGQLVERTAAAGGSLELNTEHYTTGIYFYKVAHKKKSLTGKMMIVK